MSQWKKISMTLMPPPEVEEINLPQTGILRLSRDPGVLPPHNLCFYQGTDQPGRSPEIMVKFSANYKILYISRVQHELKTKYVFTSPA